MGLLSCLASTLPPRVSSVLKRRLWQLACCWLEGALSGMVHQCSKWPNSRCQELRKEKSLGAKNALRVITKREAGSTAIQQTMLNFHQSLFSLLPPFLSPSSHFPLLYPILHCHLVLRSLELNPNYEEASAPVRSGPSPSPTSSLGCSPKRLWQRCSCSLLNTNCTEKLPGNWVESWFPPNPHGISQILKGLFIIIIYRPTSLFRSFLKGTA